MNAQLKIMQWCIDDADIAKLAAISEGMVLHKRPELDPGSEEFYQEVLREMGQSE